MPRLKRKLHSRNLPSKQESEVPGALAESEPTPILLDDRNENLAVLGMPAVVAVAKLETNQLTNTAMKTKRPCGLVR